MSNEIQVNTTLHTKDGRKIGNAIVTNIQPDQGMGCIVYRFTTDYGNVGLLTREEIDGLFWVGKVNDTHKHATTKFDVIDGLLAKHRSTKQKR